MGIGDNTRQIILGRLAKSHSLSEIDYCQELWIQTHSYKSICFIGLTSHLVFDRKAFFIHSTHEDMRSDIYDCLNSDVVLSLRRAIITVSYTHLTLPTKRIV